MANDSLNEHPQQPLSTTPAAPASKKQRSYFRNIGEATRTLLGGLKLTWRHFLESRESRKPVGVEHENYFEQQTGIVTLQYPRESLPVPDNARYRLHNEIEDCIVCDKCAKVCPVDCIEIEPVKAVESIGQTSDGTSKRIYAAKFDIDMAKCCFCGLCTTVCPTECLTMTKVYDFSEFDVADHTYAFSEMTPLEILQKRKELEEYQAQKAAAKPAAKATAPARPGVARPGVARPAAARPAAARPVAPKSGTPGEAAPKSEEDVQEAARKLMAQKHSSGVAQHSHNTLAEVPNPTVKSAPTPEGTEDSPAPGAEKPKFRPRVVMKPKTTGRGEGEDNTAAAPPSAASQENDTKQNTALQAAPQQAAPKPRPVMKPVVKKAAAPSEELPAAKATTTDAAAPKQAAPEQAEPAQAASAQKEASAAPARPRPVIKPLIKRTAPAADIEAAAEAPQPAAGSPAAESPLAKPRPVVKPVIRKAGLPASASKEGDLPAAEQHKPRPVIKPIVPKQSMQADETPEEKKADGPDIKQPKPIVEKKVVVRKPPQEDKSEDDKQQEEGQRPGPPGKSL